MSKNLKMESSKESRLAMVIYNLAIIFVINAFVVLVMIPALFNVKYSDMWNWILLIIILISSFVISLILTKIKKYGKI